MISNAVRRFWFDFPLSKGRITIVDTFKFPTYSTDLFFILDIVAERQLPRCLRKDRLALKTKTPPPPVYFLSLKKKEKKRKDPPPLPRLIESIEID